jgi:uncharacterized membrane protein
MSPILVLHICGGIVGLLSGGAAFAFRKGSSRHRAAGNVFFISMLCMSGGGAFMAAFMKPNIGNVFGGVLTFYLVATGWLTVYAQRGTNRPLGNWLAAFGIGGGSWWFDLRFGSGE